MIEVFFLQFMDNIGKIPDHFQAIKIYLFFYKSIVKKSVNIIPVLTRIHATAHAWRKISRESL